MPTGYGFRMHHYGPYSEELDDDLVLLKVTGYVNISPDPEGYGFHVKPADEPEAAWGKPVAAYKNEVQRVSQLFAERPAYELELAATLHYVNHLLDPLQRSQLIEIVGSLKPRFDREQIAKMHEEMKAEGLA
ncbi:MAG: hypothetical protein HYY00_07375 [Chloroflexi bacterium]|nr:hypothetical protein [Chloroflexota bacterium]